MKYHVGQLIDPTRGGHHALPPGFEATCHGVCRLPTRHLSYSVEADTAGEREQEITVCTVCGYVKRVS